MHHSIHSTADINECELELHPCHCNANCTDSVGSFKCTCGKGFEGDGFTCTGKQLMDWLTGLQRWLSSWVNISLQNTNSCSCSHGKTEPSYFIMQIVTNVWITSWNKCHQNALYIFVFPDIDECEDDFNNCDENAQCTNTEGSFTCSCYPGYAGDGRTECTGEWVNNIHCNNSRTLIPWVAQKCFSFKNQCWCYKHMVTI